MTATESNTDVVEGYWRLERTENPQPISPLAASFVLPAFTDAARALFADIGLLADTAAYREIGGWVYTSITPLPVDGSIDMEARLARCVARGHDLAVDQLDRWRDEWRPELVRRAEAARAVLLVGLDDAGLAIHLDDLRQLFARAAEIHFVLHGVNALVLGELVSVGDELFGWTAAACLDLLAGLSPASSEPGERLRALAETAREIPEVRRALQSVTTHDAAGIDVMLAEADLGFAAEFRRFVDDFGTRGLRYEVAEPTLGESAAALLGCVRDLLDAPPEAGDAAAKRESARARARVALKHHGTADREVFERTLALAERTYPVREDNEVWTTSVPFGLVRTAVLEAGRRMGVDNVFLFTYDEIAAALRGAPLPPVAARAVAWDGARRSGAPPTIGERPPAPSLDSLPPEAAEVHRRVEWAIDSVLATEASSQRQLAGASLSGIGASPGVYTGPARLVLSESEFAKLRPGDVLVCPTTSPVWSFLFPNLGALVADTGGLLAHHAIISREYGIPAVIATGNGTELIQDGQIITVDGSRGVVALG